MTAAMLSACGGGGGTANSVASIAGQATASTAKGSTTVLTGTLTVSDADSGQASFQAPTTGSLNGAYGTFTFNTATGVWTYTLDNTKTATASLSADQSVKDNLTVLSLDGSATQIIAITITGSASGGSTGSIPLVTSVPAPVYPTNDPYASEKVAVFNRLNDDRARCGFGKVAQNTKLDQAAQAHADYLALNKLQNGHTELENSPGFTGKTAGERMTHANYSYSAANEILTDQLFGLFFQGTEYSTFELPSTNTLKDLYASIYHLSGAFSSSTEVGIGVSVHANSAIAHVKTVEILLSTPANLSSNGQQIEKTEIATFPCEGISGLMPKFGPEMPNPFPNVDLGANPYGHPVYLLARNGNSLTLKSGSMQTTDGAIIPTIIFSNDNDPQCSINGNPLVCVKNNQSFLVPTTRLQDNTTYKVHLEGTNSGLISPSNATGSFVRDFSFTTGTFTSE